MSSLDDQKGDVCLIFTVEGIRAINYKVVAQQLISRGYYPVARQPF
jgi:hypothetical protein